MKGKLAKSLATTHSIPVMDQGLKMLPLLAVLLITLRCAFGFPGVVYSKSNLRWGQASHSAFAPHAVQSSQSEYPVTGSISVDEVGSSLIIDRSQKSTSRFSNPRRYVKGGFSSSHETSRTQTGSVSAALSVPQDELQKSSLTSLQPQVSSSSSVQNIASQLASGQSLQNQYSSSSHGGSGLQSAGGLRKIVSHQREGSSSGLLSSPDVPSPHTPESNVKLSPSPLMVSSQSTTAQSSPIHNMSSTLESSGPLLGVSGSATSFSGASTEHVSSPSEIYHQPAGDKGSLRIHASGSESSLPLQSPGAAVHVYSSESLSSSPSIETQGSTFTSQGSPITAQVISSGPVIVTTQEVSSGSIGSPSQSISSQYSPGTLTPSKLGSLSLWVSNQSTSDQSQYMSGAPSRSGMPLASSSHYVPLQTGSSSRDLSSPKPQGTYAVYAPSSTSKYLNVAASSPQSVSFQSGSDQDFRWTVAEVGTQAGESIQFMSSQGGSSSFSGALSHPQSSPSKYSSGALKPTSPQTVSRPLTSVASSHGSSGELFGASSQSASQGMSSGFSGSMQSLGTSSQNVPSSPTFSKLSSSRLVSSQSTSDPGLYGTVPSTSQIGSWPQSGLSSQFVPSQGAGSSYSGSFPQSQSSSPKYSLGHPKLNLPQTVSRQSASVKGSHGSSVDPLGAFSQSASHGMSSSFRGSAQAQGTFSQPAPSSPTVSKFSSSRQVFSQSTSDQDLYGQLTTTSQFGSQPQTGTSKAASGFNRGSLKLSQGSLGQYTSASPSKYVNAALPSHGFASEGMSSGFSGSAQGTFMKPAPSSPSVSKFSSSRQIYSQSTSDQDLYGQLSAISQFGSQPQTGTSQQLSQAASGINMGSLKLSQGSLGQYTPASPSKYVNAALPSHGFASEGMSSSFSGSAQGTFKKPAPSSPTVSKFSSSRQVYSQSTSDQDLYGQLSATSQFGSQPQTGTSKAASGFNRGSLKLSQGSLGQYTSASPSKYVNAALSSHGFASEGMSSGFSGSAPGTFMKPAPSSPSVSKFSSSRQIYSQSTSDQDLYGQLSAISQFGSQPQTGTSQQLSQAASSINMGSLKLSQGSLGQYTPASPSKYVNAALPSHGFASEGMSSSFSGSAQGTFKKPAPSSPTVSKFSSSRQVYSQSTSDQDLYGQLSATSQFGSQPQTGTSQAASGFNRGSLKLSQGSLGQYTPASPSKYINAALPSHGFASEGMSSGFSGSAQGTFKKPAPSSPTVSKFSSSREVYSQSTSDQDLYGQLSATSQFGPQSQTGTSQQLSQAASGFNRVSLKLSQGSLGQYTPASPSKYVNAALPSHGFASEGMSSSFSGSAQGTFRKPAPSSPTVSKFSSSRQVYSQSTSDQDLYGQLSAISQFGSQPQTGTSQQLSQAASGINMGSLKLSQGSLGQYTPASPSKYVNAALPSHGFASEGMSSSFSGSAQGTFKKPAPSSPTVSKFSSSRQVYSQSTSDQDLYGQLSATSQFGSQPQTGTSKAASGFNRGSLKLSQGSLGQYTSASPSKYVNAALPSHGFASEGMSSGFSGSAQGTFMKPAPSSPSVSKFSSSRQIYSQSTSDQDLYGQLSAISQFGSQPQTGTSQQLSQAASGINMGSLKLSQGSLGQYTPASPSKYVNAALPSHGFASEGMSSSFSGSAQGTFKKPAPSSPTVSKFSSSRQVYSQSTSDQDLYGQLSATSQFGSQPQTGTSQAASGFNRESLKLSQGSLGQYTSASPSKYVNAALPSHGFATRSATASSHRGLTSTFLGGSQSGSSLTFGGTGPSSMPQRTMSQFVSGSPSQHSSTSLSSTQSTAGQYSPASQWVFSVSQRPQRREPSVSSWSQGLQSSGSDLSQGNLQFQSSQAHSRFSSQLSAGDSANQSNPQALSKGSGQSVSSPGSSGISLQSPSTSSRYPLGSPGYVKLGSSLDSSQSGTGQSLSPYGSNLQTGSGAQHSSRSYASLQGGSGAVVGPSSQYGSVFSALDAKAGLYLSRPSAASLTQGIQTSKSASSRSTSSAQISSGFSSSLSALSQNVPPVAQSGPMSAVWRSQSPLGGVQSPSRLSSSFQAPSASTIGGQMSERFTSHNAADSSLPSSSGLSAQLSSKGMFSGSSLPNAA